MTEARRAAPLATVLLTGCAPQGAPSLVLFGSYFPAWMLCALIGIAAALAARAAFILVGLDAIMAFRLFSYSAIAVTVAAVCWLIWYGPAP
ncbi:YtcA family lipoprotein [Neoroseomonas lacus]|uniref:Uncharacterized protein YtcA n=1 Tax=Neoroseomonas lacus TaxID=287609 RepID=A0A917NJ82_9PROT|nr:YtcA family lipoprotein [Neoroseomonas lacus]GGJ04917.1 hypothetical protein GCM10011320_09810 [Neoroseomonas lacus]